MNLYLNFLFDFDNYIWICLILFCFKGYHHACCHFLSKVYFDQQKRKKDLFQAGMAAQAAHAAAAAETQELEKQQQQMLLHQAQQQHARQLQSDAHKAQLDALASTTALSGFFPADIPMLEKEADANGLKLEQTFERDGWSCLVFVNKGH